MGVKENLNKAINESMLGDSVRVSKFFMHYELADTVMDFMTDLLGRDIRAKIIRSDFYYWHIDFCDEKGNATPLTEDELKELAEIIGVEEINADDEPEYKGDALDDDDSLKLIQLIMPFEISNTSADEDGVRFIGPELTLPESLKRTEPQEEDEEEITILDYEHVCPCGSHLFTGHQLMRADVIVDGDGGFYDNLDCGLDAAVYDSEKPYGPFRCMKCHTEYDELSDVGKGD